MRNAKSAILLMPHNSNDAFPKKKFTVGVSGESSLSLLLTWNMLSANILLLCFVGYL